MSWLALVRARRRVALIACRALSRILSSRFSMSSSASSPSTAITNFMVRNRVSDQVGYQRAFRDDHEANVDPFRSFKGLLPVFRTVQYRGSERQVAGGGARTSEHCVDDLSVFGLVSLEAQCPVPGELERVVLTCLYVQRNNSEAGILEEVSFSYRVRGDVPFKYTLPDLYRGGCWKIPRVQHPVTQRQVGANEHLPRVFLAFGSDYRVPPG